MRQTKIAIFPGGQRKLDMRQQPRRPEQLGLWPLTVRRMYPPDDAAGSGYRGIALAENGYKYYLRGKQAHRLAPFSELFAYELCRACTITTPPHERVELDDGEIVFGSRNELGVINGHELTNLITSDPTLHYEVGLQFSRLLAIDAFLANSDRSFSNVLWLPPEPSDEPRPPSYQEGKIPGTLLAINFANSFFTSEPILASPGLYPKSASWCLYTLLRNNGLLEARELGKTLDNIFALADGFFDMVLQRCPSSWLDGEDLQRLSSWWTSPIRGLRVDETKRWLTDALQVSIRHN